MVKPPVGN